MQRRDRIILEKINSELQIGLEMMKGVDKESFLQNEMLKRAVCMTTINIGELIKSVSEETKIAFPMIEWKAIAGMRDLAAHKYQTLRMEDVYWTAVSDYPVLLRQISEILSI